ncbi:MAG: phosphatidate cytidylyltransferase [bacterium]|nr:phosphatidate cytidylyltransferase [bacterium]
MKQRIISAVVLIAVFIPFLLIGRVPFAILMSVLACMGLYELFKARKKKKEFPIIMRFIAYILVIFLTLTNYNVSGGYSYFLLDYRLIAVLIFAYITPIVFVNNSKKYNINDALFLIGSTLFIGISFNVIIALRNYSLVYIIYILLLATITDTFALLTGRKIGKNKLAPLISPNKTIEGSIGGSIMGTFIGSIFFIETTSINVSVIAVVMMSLILTILGQIGDLSFSAIKRYYDTKDFSNLIPGHGGILDRLDSIIFIVLGFLIFLSVL